MLYNGACIGVIGIQDICHFTSRDIGYYPFYFQGYRILCSISGILCFCRKIKKKNRKKHNKSPFERRELRKKSLSERFFSPSQPYCFDGEFLQTARRRLSEIFREITASVYRKGVEKAVAKWSVMSNILSIQKDQPEPSLKTFICELKTKHGLSSRCKDLGINMY